MRPGPLLLRLAMTASLAAAGPAFACGQGTHIYAGLHAITHLPEGSDLRAILEDPDRLPWMINGSMFPDGGYSPLANDDYGEIAHWEPFQAEFMAWIRETWPTDQCDPAALDHMALALGMAAHGMADQVFDGLYLERAMLREPEDRDDRGQSVDEATDVAFMAQVGPMQVPVDVVPYDTLVGVFARRGHDVKANTIRSGHASLAFAVTTTSTFGQDPERVQRYVDQFPYATTHLDDRTVPGAPVCLGEIIAAYWQALWERQHGRSTPDEDWLVWTWPAPGGTHAVRDHTDIDAQAAVVLGHNATVAAVSDASITWKAADGSDIPFSRRLYYRNESNVLLLQPQADLAEDTVYTITIAGGMTSSDGTVLPSDVSWSFTTGDTSPDPQVCPGGPTLDPGPLATRPAACPDAIPQAVDSDTDPGAPADTDTDTPTDTSDAGCGCDQGGTGGLLFALPALAALRRRRQSAAG